MKLTLNPNILAALSILLWCFSGVCFRKGAELMPPLLYLSMITAGGALFALIIQIVLRQPLGDVLKPPFRVMFSGFFGVALYTVMLALAFAIAAERDVGTVNLINYLWPVWMVLLQCLLLKQSNSPVFLLSGVALGFTGLLWTRDFEFNLQTGSTILPFALALGGGFLWALYSVLLKKWSIPESKGGTTFHFFSCAALAFTIHRLHPYFRDTMIMWTPELVFWIVFGAIGPVGIAYYCWELAVKRGNPGLLASLCYLIPVGSSLILGITFRETLTWGLIPGSVLIATGAWMVGRRRRLRQ